MEKIRENVSVLMPRWPGQFKVGMRAVAAVVPLVILILKPHIREISFLILKIFGTIPFAVISHFTREKALRKRTFTQTLSVYIFKVLVGGGASLFRLRKVLPIVGIAIASQKGYTSKAFKAHWINETVHKTWKAIWVGDGAGTSNVDDPRTFESIDVVFVHLHGNGFACSTPAESLALFVELIKELEKRHNVRAFVCSIDYVLAPEYKFPVARDQILDIYIDHILGKLCIPPSKIIFSGDSAGGNLAFVASIKIRDNLHNRHVPIPSALVLMSPWVSLQTTSPSYAINAHRDYVDLPEIENLIANYIKDTGIKRTDPEVSPLFTPSFAGLPPMAVTIGNHELFRDDLRTFVENVRDSGVRCEEIENEIGVHDWIIAPALSGGESRWAEGVSKIVEFVVSTRK